MILKMFCEKWPLNESLTLNLNVISFANYNSYYEFSEEEKETFLSPKCSILMLLEHRLMFIKIYK